MKKYSVKNKAIPELNNTFDYLKDQKSKQIAWIVCAGSSYRLEK
ncbi:MAG: hypothetical protein R3B66_17440 [Candidatus Scalinduaceae bacterium]